MDLVGIDILNELSASLIGSVVCCTVVVVVGCKVVVLFLLGISMRNPMPESVGMDVVVLFPSLGAT